MFFIKLFAVVDSGYGDRRRLEIEEAHSLNNLACKIIFQRLASGKWQTRRTLTYSICFKNFVHTKNSLVLCVKSIIAILIGDVKRNEHEARNSNRKAKGVKE